MVLTVRQIRDLRSVWKPMKDPGWDRTLIDGATPNGPNLTSRAKVAKYTTGDCVGILYVVFRRAIVQPANFCLVLVFEIPDGTTYRIMRCDGPVGFHVNHLCSPRPIVNHSHIHHLTECYQRRFGIQKGEAHAIPTRLYYDDPRVAVRVLALKTHIEIQGELWL